MLLKAILKDMKQMLTKIYEKALSCCQLWQWFDDKLQQLDIEICKLELLQNFFFFLFKKEENAP